MLRASPDSGDDESTTRCASRRRAPHSISARFKLHFTPKGASRTDMVEAWLSQLTKKQIRRDSFGNTYQVIMAAKEFVTEYEKNPRAFVWTVDANEIL